MQLEEKRTCEDCRFREKVMSVTKSDTEAEVVLTLKLWRKMLGDVVNGEHEHLMGQGKRSV